MGVRLSKHHYTSAASSWLYQFIEYLRAWESDDLGSCNVSKESVSKLGKAI